MSFQLLEEMNTQNDLILKNFFLLKDNCFTEFCCFLLNLNMN